MNNLSDLLKAPLRDGFNYDSRKLMRLEPDENEGLGVSTAYTSDMGYETALLDENGVHPVERYTDKESAKRGHEKWVKFATDPQNTHVTKLGYADFLDSKKIELKRAT